MALACPIGYTCPDIDEVIRSVKSVLETTKVIKSKLENVDEQKMSPNMWVEFIDSLKDENYEIEGYLYSTEKKMEALRDANEKLREWGLDANNKVDELEDKITELEEDIEGLNEANAGADL